jgi:radical SAM protein with 4Fe4S-binding SPASM domain
MMQDAPFCVQLELVEGCTLACDFCGVQGMRDRPGAFKFMTKSTMMRIASEFKHLKSSGWNPRFEFAMHGEPTVNPDVVTLIRIFRDAVGPKSSITMLSNATALVAAPNKINDLLNAGLNVLALDDYEPNKFASKVVSKYAAGQFPVLYYPQNSNCSPHQVWKGKWIIVVEDITKASTGTHSSLNTHCGAGMKPPENLPLQQRCAKPFRELSIRWDGNVALCCNDFRGVYKCGSVMDTPIDELWQNKFFDAARRKLYHSDRGFSPCDKCNARSYRLGLLPDKKGLQDLEPPSTDDEQTLKEATGGSPYAQVVLREWEK